MESREKVLDNNNFGASRVDVPHVVHFKLFNGFFNFIVGVAAKETLVNCIHHVHLSVLGTLTNAKNNLVNLFIVRDSMLSSFVSADGRLGDFNQPNGFVNIATLYDVGEAKSGLCKRTMVRTMTETHELPTYQSSGHTENAEQSTSRSEGCVLVITSIVSHVDVRCHHVLGEVIRNHWIKLLSHLYESANSLNGQWLKFQRWLAAVLMDIGDVLSQL